MALRSHQRVAHLDISVGVRTEYCCRAVVQTSEQNRSAVEKVSGEAMVLAVLQFIPLALAAITPTMVIFVTALLAQDGNAKRAVAVVAGRYFGLLIFGLVALFVLHQVPKNPAKGRLSESDVLPVVFLVVGIVLLLAAVYTMIFGQVPTEQNQSSMLERLRRLHAFVLFGACLVTAFVSIRQISLLLAGTAIIKESADEWAEELVLLGILCLMMVSPMLVPLGIKFGMGERGDAVLERLRNWMGVHQRGINAVVLAFFGGMLVAKGIGGI